MSLESTTQKEVEELKDRWNKIDINVLWREGKENKIPTNKAITYAELLQQLWIVFELFDEPEFEDLKQAIGNAEVAAFAPSPPPLPAPCALSATSRELEDDEATDAWDDSTLQPVQRLRSTLVAAAASSTGQALGLTGAVPLDRVRLRKYNLHTKMSTEIIDVSVSGEITLGDLYFYR